MNVRKWIVDERGERYILSLMVTISIFAPVMYSNVMHYHSLVFCSGDRVRITLNKLFYKTLVQKTHTNIQIHTCKHTRMHTHIKHTRERCLACSLGWTYASLQCKPYK